MRSMQYLYHRIWGWGEGFVLNLSNTIYQNTSIICKSYLLVHLQGQPGKTYGNALNNDLQQDSKHSIFDAIFDKGLDLTLSFQDSHRISKIFDLLLFNYPLVKINWFMLAVGLEPSGISHQSQCVSISPSSCNQSIVTSC